RRRRCSSPSPAGRGRCSTSTPSPSPPRAGRAAGRSSGWPASAWTSATPAPPTGRRSSSTPATAPRRRPGPGPGRPCGRWARGGTEAAAASAYDVLGFSETAGVRHDAIPAGIQAIRDLGAANNFTVTATEDATQFSTANLARFEAVVFLSTTGDVLDATQQTAF